MSDTSTNTATVLAQFVRAAVQELKEAELHGVRFAEALASLEEVATQLEQHSARPRGWIGVDLDGTLAEYSGRVSVDHVGTPVPRMVDRVKAWLAEGIDVRIVTARVAFGEPGVVRVIEDWCEQHLGQRLRITATKDFGMVELWDDRCVQVIPNTGLRADGSEIIRSR